MGMDPAQIAGQRTGAIKLQRPFNLLLAGEDDRQAHLLQPVISGLPHTTSDQRLAIVKQREFIIMGMMAVMLTMMMIMMTALTTLSLFNLGIGRPIGEGINVKMPRSTKMSGNGLPIICGQGNLNK
jgi:hypothetical protein